MTVTAVQSPYPKHYLLSQQRGISIGILPERACIQLNRKAGILNLYLEDTILVWQVSISQKEAEILQVMFAAYPDIVYYEQILSLIINKDEDECRGLLQSSQGIGMHKIRSAVSHLRPKLTYFNLKLVAASLAGYTLQPIHDPQIYLTHLRKKIARINESVTQRR
jgi:hypothetical protein